MALDSNGMSAADMAAVLGNDRNDGIFGGGGFWMLVLFVIFAMFGNNGFGGNAGGYGYQAGFDQAAVMGALNTISASQAAGFAGVEASANARQIASMQADFALQTQLANCCCENRLAVANLGSDIAREACADRAAVSDALTRVLESNNAGIQKILDTMCQDKIDAKNEQIANLRQQLTMQQLAASQNAQTQMLIASNEAQTAALEQYLAPTPRPAYVVPNPNCCQQNYGCGCGSF